MGEIPETRHSLLLRLAATADEAAWQDFVQIYEPVIVRMGMRKGLQLSDAQDLCQEVLHRVARSITNWNPDRAKGSFRGWLATVTRNLIVDHFRKQRRVPTAVSDSVLGNYGDVGLAEMFEDEERHQVFCWAGNQARRYFSETTWRAFWMSCVEGETPQNTARQLDLSVGAVYIARSRVLARIKEMVLQAEAGFQLTSESCRSPKHEQD